MEQTASNTLESEREELSTISGESETSFIGDMQRPSYLGDSLKPIRQESFDQGVIKKLDARFEAVGKPEKDEKVQTFLRIRPLCSKSTTTGVEKDVLEIIDSESLVIYNDKQPNSSSFGHEFKFNKIFDGNCSQSSLFETCILPCMEAYLEGNDCLIFSYGTTNSGKTYTMQGFKNQFGIIPRTLDMLFNRLEGKIYFYGNIKPSGFSSTEKLKEEDRKSLERLKAEIIRKANVKRSREAQSFMESLKGSKAQDESASSTMSNRTMSSIRLVPCGEVQNHSGILDEKTIFSIWVGFLEVYNEKVYDLLQPTEKGKVRKELKLLSDREGNVLIKNQIELPVHSAEEAFELFLAGKSHLQFAPTSANVNSSRSHSFFTIRLVSLGVSNLHVYPENTFRISFCDLAGTERVLQTQNEGAKLKESNIINNSLMALLRCITALRNQQSGTFNSLKVPFRDSKLTRVFYGYLSRSTNVRMIVNINPDPKLYWNNLQILKHSAIASQLVTFKPVEISPPDTSFYKNYRASFSVKPENSSASCLRENSNSQASESSDEDDGDSSADSDAENVSTVKKNDVSLQIRQYQDEIRHLKSENKRLVVRIGNIASEKEREIRETLGTKFCEIIRQERQFWRELMVRQRQSDAYFAEENISLALQEAEEHLPQAVDPSVFEEDEEDDVEKNTSSTEFYRTCRENLASDASREVEMVDESAASDAKMDQINESDASFSESQDDSEEMELEVTAQSEDHENKKLKEELTELKTLYEAQKVEFERQTEELMEEKNNLLERIASAKHLEELKSAEIEEYSKKLEVLLMSNDALHRLNRHSEKDKAAKIKELTTEIQEARELVKLYESKLTEANEKIITLGETSRQLYDENETLKNENLFLSHAEEEVSNLKTENEILNEKLQELNRIMMQRDLSKEPLPSRGVENENSNKVAEESKTQIMPSGSGMEGVRRSQRNTACVYKRSGADESKQSEDADESNDTIRRHFKSPPPIRGKRTRKMTAVAANVQKWKVKKTDVVVRQVSTGCVKRPGPEPAHHGSDGTPILVRIYSQPSKMQKEISDKNKQTDYFNIESFSNSDPTAAGGEQEFASSLTIKHRFWGRIFSPGFWFRC